MNTYFLFLFVLEVRMNNITQEDTTQELVIQLKENLSYHRSLLVNPFTQEFMSIDSRRITCPLIVEDGHIKPNLTLSRNDKVLKICSEFQENAIYFDAIQNKRGSLEYGFSDTGDRIICRITDFDNILEHGVSTRRIIQFDQNSQETNVIQWLGLKKHVKQSYIMDDYDETILNKLQNSLKMDLLSILNKLNTVLGEKPISKIEDVEGDIESLIITKQRKLSQLPKSYWFNFTPEGFIVCITDPVKKTLIVTLKNDRSFGNIPISKKIPLTMIRLVWPELAIRKRQANEMEDVLISEKLEEYFPNVAAGVLRITKFHNDKEIKCYQTHKSCC